MRQVNLMSALERPVIISVRYLPQLLIGGWVLILGQLILTNFPNLKLKAEALFQSQLSQHQTLAEDLTTANQIHKSRFSTELVALDQKWPNMVKVKNLQPGKSESIVFNAITLLKTDNNRPRVNKDVAQLFNTLVAKVRYTSKSKFVLMASSEVPENQIQPLIKYMENFFRLRVDVKKTQEPGKFELIMESSI